MRLSKYSTNLLLFVIVVSLSSCFVSKKKYEELKLVKEYYEAEADSSDSIRTEYRRLYDSNRTLESEIKDTYKDLEELTATNISLNNAYQDLLNRYNQSIGNTQDVLASYSYEKQAYQRRLDQQQEELDKKNVVLQQQNNQNLSQGNGSTTPQPYNNTQQLGALQSQVTQVLGTANASDIGVYTQNGKLYISLTDQFLFSGRRLSANATTKLQQLAPVFNRFGTANVSIHGHSTNKGSTQLNQQDSASKATVVEKALKMGSSAISMSAQGHGADYKIDSNNSARNERVDIIVSL